MWRFVGRRGGRRRRREGGGWGGRFIEAHLWLSNSRIWAVAISKEVRTLCERMSAYVWLLCVAY